MVILYHLLFQFVIYMSGGSKVSVHMYADMEVVLFSSCHEPLPSSPFTHVLHLAGLKFDWAVIWEVESVLLFYQPLDTK